MAKSGKRRFLSGNVLEGLPLAATGLFRSASLFRTLASLARRRRDRATDVFYRRRVCALQPKSSDNWVQLGHSLKEIGFYGRARDAYTKALSLAPDSAKIHLELAHLAKMDGNFQEAEDNFLKASEFGLSDNSELISELKLLDDIENSIIYSNRLPGKIEELHIYLSAPTALIDEKSIESISAGLGKSDYSYAFAMRGFVSALETLGYNYTLLKNAEFVADIRDRSNAKINIHIGFYPPERLRLLKGAYNINCFAWEFDRLRAPSELLSYHAFSDQTTMLHIVDEVWVPSIHGAEAVGKSVKKPVHAVPAPVIITLPPAARDDAPKHARIWHLAQNLCSVPWQPLAVFARLQESMNQEAKKRETTLSNILRTLPSSERPLIFLTILNVHDFRKQLYPMIRGFIEFQTANADAILLIKITTPDRGKLPINTFLLMDQILDAGELPHPLVSDRIWITDQVLSRAELDELYKLSAFYVCTSYAEGQNLPILEAMGRGVVPVSVDNTAMADYINEETAIPIRSEPRPFGPRLASRYGLYGLETNFVEASDARQAFERAAMLAPEEYASRSAAALDLVKRDYGAEHVAQALDRVITTIQMSGKNA